MSRCPASVPGMRNYTEKQLAVMLSEGGYASHYRVKVDAGGTWYDLTNLEGRNFTKGVSWDSTIDSFVADASVELNVLLDDFSVAPLVDSVLNSVPTDGRPLLDEARLFVIEVALTPLGTLPEDGDWIEVFRGMSAKTNVAGRPQLVGRDEGDSLSDLIIKVELDYGSDAGVPLLTVLNQILSDNGWPYAAVQEEDPEFLVGPFRQKKEIVREALMALVDQIGWDMRVKWNDAAGAWKLTLWTPDRNQVEPDWSYSPGQCRVVSRCETSVEDVRNQWVGTYLDKEDLDAAGKPKQKPIIVEDSDSISRYSPIPGANIPRTTLVAEGGTTNIDTAAEMTRMLSAALADFKDVMLEVETEVPFNPFLEVGDMVRLEANPLYFSEDHDLGVQSVAHSFTKDGAVTSLTLRGRPSTSRRRWMQYESAGNAAPTYSRPNPPASVSATPTINGFAVKVLPAVTGRTVDTWELHTSTVSGFTPDNSANSTTLMKTFKGVGTDVTSLVAGRTYYAKLVGRDTKGNRSDPSAEFSLTARYVEPRSLLPRVSTAALPVNADYEAQSETNQPPDGHSLEVGTWGIDAATTTASVYGGSRAVAFLPTPVATAIAAQWFTVRPDDALLVTVPIAIPGAADPLNEVLVAVRWRNASGAIIQTDVIGANSALGTNDWFIVGRGYRGKAPAGSGYAEIVAAKTAARAFTAYVDSVRATLLPTSTITFFASLQGTWTSNLATRPAQYVRDITGRVTLRGEVSGGAGAIFTLPPGYRPPYTVVSPVVVTGGSFGAISIATSGVVTLVAGVQPVSLDGVSFLVDV